MPRLCLPPFTPPCAAQPTVARPSPTAHALCFSECSPTNARIGGGARTAVGALPLGRSAAVLGCAAAAASAAAAGRNCLFPFSRACVCVRTLTRHLSVALLLPLLLLLLLLPVQVARPPPVALLSVVAPPFSFGIISARTRGRFSARIVIAWVVRAVLCAIHVCASCFGVARSPSAVRCRRSPAVLSFVCALCLIFLLRSFAATPSADSHPRLTFALPSYTSG